MKKKKKKKKKRKYCTALGKPVSLRVEYRMRSRFPDDQRYRNNLYRNVNIGKVEEDTA
jgi:hypothetical protein